MRIKISQLSKLLILSALTICFVFSIGIAVITWFSPDRIIQVIQNLRPEPTVSPSQLKGVGILGDSQSDEYRADDTRGNNFDTVTYNWVEILQRERNINFGEWGVYPEPRRTGYSYNWARSGATANSMIVSGQHIGLAEQVKSGEVNTVIIYIGANDYAPFITQDGYDAIYNGTLSQAEIIRKRNQIVSDIKTAVDVLQDAGDAKIIIVAIPHWSNNFGISLAYPIPERRRKVVDTVTNTNDSIKKLADEYKISVIDPNEFYNTITEQNQGSVVVGAIKLERLLINNDPRNMFLDDGIHPGTVINALFANEVITTLNKSLGTTINPLSDTEILNIVNLNK